MRPITNFSLAERSRSVGDADRAPKFSPAWLRRFYKDYIFSFEYSFQFNGDLVPGLFALGEKIEYQFSCGDKYLIIMTNRDGHDHYSAIEIFLFGPDWKPLSWARMVAWINLDTRLQRFWYAMTMEYNEPWWETGPPPLDALEIHDERRLRFHLLGQGWFELEVLRKPRRFLRWAWDCNHRHRWPWERRYMNIRRLTKGPVEDRPPGAAKQTHGRPLENAR